jgi:hypothetical protein
MRFFVLDPLRLLRDFPETGGSGQGLFLLAEPVVSHRQEGLVRGNHLAERLCVPERDEGLRELLGKGRQAC